MQAVYHSLGVVKLLASEIVVAIIPLPVIVNHKDACRKAVLKHMLGVVFDIRLILVIHQFNPGVILWLREEYLLRNGTGRWEIL